MSGERKKHKEDLPVGDFFFTGRQGSFAGSLCSVVLVRCIVAMNLDNNKKKKKTKTFKLPQKTIW